MSPKRNRVKLSLVGFVIMSSMTSACGYTTYTEYDYEPVIFLHKDLVLEFEIIGNYSDGAKNTVIQGPPYYFRVLINDTGATYISSEVIEGNFTNLATGEKIDISSMINKKKIFAVQGSEFPLVGFLRDGLYLDFVKHEARFLFEFCDKSKCFEIEHKGILKPKMNIYKKNKFLEAIQGT